METPAMLALVMLCVCTAYSLETPDDRCNSLKSTDIKLSLKVYKNITGNWLTRVTLNHAPALTQTVDKQLDLCNVDIDQTTLPCENGDAFAFVATLSSPNPNRRAGTGYEFYPGVGYYKFHTTVLNWEQARDKCVEEGAHLAVINSEAESRALLQVWSYYPEVKGSNFQQFVYIGFHDRDIEGQHVTIFGTPLKSTGFTRWFGKDQPDNAGGGPDNPGEDCGSIERNGGLNDINCGLKLAFICEQEL